MKVSNKRKLADNQLFIKPDVRRRLNFDNTSPIVIKVNDVPINNYNRRYAVTPEKQTNLPSVDTPKQNLILRNGICSENVLGRIITIGNGSFGTVVKAKYKSKKVAVKIICKDNKMKCDALINETNAMKLNHQNVINTIKVVNNCDAAYGLVIMELWCATNMQYLIDQSAPNSISMRTKIRYLLDICEGLQYCHNNRVVHLDIKPKNILVRRTFGNEAIKSNDLNFCKICDFGCSLLIDEYSGEKKTSNYVQKQGTVKYMAPELLQGKMITFKSDVYSLGITMWQLFHQNTPYHGEPLHSIIYKVVSQNYRPRKYEAQSTEEKILKDLYRNCWHTIADVRPTILSIKETLTSIIGIS